MRIVRNTRFSQPQKHELALTEIFDNCFTGSSKVRNDVTCGICLSVTSQILKPYTYNNIVRRGFLFTTDLIINNQDARKMFKMPEAGEYREIGKISFDSKPLHGCLTSYDLLTAKCGKPTANCCVRIAER